MPRRCWIVTFSLNNIRSAAKRLPGSQEDPQLTIDKALELLLDPVTGSKAVGKRVEGVITLHVDDVLMTGSKEFSDRICANLNKDFRILVLGKLWAGSELIGLLGALLSAK